MKPAVQLLLQALQTPAIVANWEAWTWEAVLPQAKAAGLLGRLVAQAQRQTPDLLLPAQVLQAVRAPLLLAEQQSRAVRWEMALLEESLAPLDGPILLLKGAAYAAAQLPPAVGRVFTDIDLMVPAEQIDRAEQLLRFSGWICEPMDAYDQRYYRTWMHELPPMHHMRRGTSLDLHHRLLPLTARLRSEPGPIFAAAEPLAGSRRLSIPSELDRILHSACHLFHEGEWVNGLRDLSDLDLLLRDALARRDESLWPELLARAAALDLGRPLFYALRYCKRLLATPVPESALRACPSAPPAGLRLLMDAVFLPALSGGFDVHKNTRTTLACAVLYIRSHALRMPLHLLLPHLFNKALRSLKENPEPPQNAQAQ